MRGRMGGMKQPDDYSPAIDACTHVRNRAALVFVLAFLSVMVLEDQQRQGNGQRVE
jgi:hypothetical protein